MRLDKPEGTKVYSLKFKKKTSFDQLIKQSQTDAIEQEFPCLLLTFFHSKYKAIGRLAVASVFFIDPKQRIRIHVHVPEIMREMNPNELASDRSGKVFSASPA